ncbi:hypothetical protein PCANC_00667 [Puccinia coronata f. sp. avenae]|uniref:Uncharacterized protein n=2 Tax=Puccinia coronata f. sp. avenae TaxID=200324 RepID=A0A2N5W754_9BASI|nr:hypothetical protein PCANC_00667 [Puccinia coronata f. sp. avenae]
MVYYDRTVQLESQVLFHEDRLRRLERLDWWTEKSPNYVLLAPEWSAVDKLGAMELPDRTSTENRLRRTEQLMERHYDRFRRLRPVEWRPVEDRSNRLEPPSWRHGEDWLGRLERLSWHHEFRLSRMEKLDQWLRARRLQASEATATSPESVT